MDIRNTLEYPLPVLAVSAKEIAIEAGHEGNFNIKNSGGGTLEGQIVSPSRSLVFEPSNWEGNRQKINFRLTSDHYGWKPGEAKTFSVLVLSNGGEAYVSITVRMAKKSDPTSSPDDIFALSGFKKRATLSVSQPAIEHLRKPGDYTPVYGHFTVQKNDDGYVQAHITPEGPEAPWMLLTDQSLTNADFNEEHTANIMYTIDPLLIPGRFAQAKVAVTTSEGEKETEIDIIYNRMTPLRAWLSREGYSYQDEGMIIVENQGDESMQVDIACRESFVRFHQKRYKVDGQLNIPFTIKLSPLQSAQMLLRKTPFLSADIEIHTKYRGKAIKKKLSLVAGDILQKQLQNAKEPLQSVKEPLAEGFNIKKAVGFALRHWLTYAIADVPEPREYLHQANYKVLSLLRKNGSDIRLFWLAAYFAIELGHLDKAREMLDKVYPYRSSYKSKYPQHYSILHFLYAYLEIKQNRIKSAVKYMNQLEAVNKSGPVRVPLMLGILHLALEQYEEAYELFIQSYDEGSRSVFLFNGLLTYYRSVSGHTDTDCHPSQPSLRQDILLKTIHWAVNHGADVEDMLTNYQEMPLSEDLLSLGERIYLKFPNRWMLRALCLHYMATLDYGPKAYSYYRDAERRQVDLPYLSHFLIRAAFENKSEKIHHYTMTQYLQKSNDPEASDKRNPSSDPYNISNEDMDLQVYVYHLLLTDPGLSDLAAGLENEILHMAEYCLQNNIRSRQANSLYYFFWTKCNQQQIHDKNTDVVEKILLDDLCTFEITDPNETTQAQYLYVKEWERQDVTKSKFPQNGTPLIIKAVSGGFRYAAVDAKGFQLVDRRLDIRKRIEPAGTALYHHFYEKGVKDFEVTAYLAKAYIQARQKEAEKSSKSAETSMSIPISVLKEALASDQASAIFITQCNMALGRFYYNLGQSDTALEYYDKTDENALDDTALEHMLTAYVQQQVWKKATGLIERKGYRLKDRILFNTIRPIADKAPAKWHPFIADTAYQLLLHSHYDKHLLEVVLAHFTGTQTQWLDLSKALSSVSIRDARLDEIILKNAAWAHHFDEDTQRVFIRSAGFEDDTSISEKCLQDFVYYAVHEMIIKRVKPLPETIAAFERIYLMQSVNSDHIYHLLSYGLCHVYLEHEINTLHSDTIIQAAIQAQEENGILFPIFRGSKKIKNTYIEKYRPLMYKTLPGKNVRLYYKVDEEEDWRIKDMEYWRFGLYLTCVPHFYNENLTYYFSEELPTGSIATQEQEISNRDVYLDDEQKDLFFIINNAVIYEQMFRYEQVEEIIGDLVKDVSPVRSRLL